MLAANLYQPVNKASYFTNFIYLMFFVIQYFKHFGGIELDNIFKTAKNY
jgi:hypothetical protein